MSAKLIHGASKRSIPMRDKIISAVKDASVTAVKVPRAQLFCSETKRKETSDTNSAVAM